MLNNNLSLYDIIQYTENNDNLVNVIPAKRIMIISPHQDDEVIGCGGTILKYLQMSTDIIILYITDGRYGRILNADRNIEAMEAWNGYNVNQIFLLYEDSHINENCISDFINLLLKYKPEIIFIPWLLDNHIDHRNVNIFLSKAIKKTSLNSIISMYEVLYPLYVNKLVNITNEFNEKSKILDIYTSQIGYLNLQNITKEMNVLRAMLLRLKSIKYAEAFCVTNQTNYLMLIEKIFN